MWIRNKIDEAETSAKRYSLPGMVVLVDTIEAGISQRRPAEHSRTQKPTRVDCWDKISFGQKVTGPEVEKLHRIEMRFLLISDIQGNTSAVRKLCALEGSNFNAVVVAGDIGNGMESTREVFDLLQHFKCPILYVLGNWDNEIPYDTHFGPNCHHLHMKPFKCGPATFVGFSGCEAHWGLNSTFINALAAIRTKHRAGLARHAAAEKRAQPSIERIEASHKIELAELAAKARDRRKKSYKLKVARLEAKRDEATERARHHVRRIEDSFAWQMYNIEEIAARNSVLQLNRSALAKVIADSKLDPKNTVIVTHARLYKTVEDFPGVGLCVFGHSGPFADTVFKGTRFINTNALDIPVAAVPAHLGPDNYDFDDVKHINGGHYVTLEWKESGDHRVECIRFKREFPGWVPIPDADGLHVVGNPFLE